MKKNLFVLVVILFCSFGALQAQDAQVSFDPNAKFLVITQQIEIKAKLFLEYPNFREASIFQTGSDSFLLEITHLKDGKLIRDKKILNFEEYKALQVRFTESAFFKSLDNRINQDGRRTLLTTTTGWSALFYGYTIPAALEFNSRATLGTYMLMTGASFYVPFISTSQAEVTKSMAYLTYYGATRSYLHGLALYGLFLPQNDSGTFKGITLTAASVSLAEMYYGYKFAKDTGISHGRSQALGLFMDYGLYSGFALSYSISGESTRFNSVLSLAGTGLGFYVGNHLTAAEDKSVGDVNMMYSTTIIGGLIANAIGNSIIRENDKMIFASSTLGATLGLYYGNQLSKQYDFSDAQGTYIAFSSIAGYLTGLGASYVFFGEISDKTINPYFIVSSLGAAGGFYVMFNYFKDKARVIDEKSAVKIDFSINPVGIAGLGMNRTTNPQLAQTLGNWGSIRLSF